MAELIVKRAAFIIILSVCVLMNTRSVKAENAGNVRLFDENAVVDEKVGGVCFLFFSNTRLDAGDADVYCFFGQINVGADFDGKIITFFSDITGEKDANIALDWHSTVFFLLILGVCQFLFCLVIFAIKRSFIEQGAATSQNEKIRVLNCGLTGIALVGALAVLLAMTVILLPVAVFVLIAGYIIAAVGETCLALAIGCFAAVRLGRKLGARTCLVCGLIFIEGLKLIPYFNIIFWIALSITTVGIVLATLLNWFYRKRFYELNFEN